MCHLDAVLDHGLKQGPAGGPCLIGDVAYLSPLVRIETEIQQKAQNLDMIAQDGRFEHALGLQVLLGEFFQVVPAAEAAAEIGLS